MILNELEHGREEVSGLKKIILYSLFFLAIVAETSCGGISQNEADGAPVSEEKWERENSRWGTKKSLDITFEDVLGNKQRLKTEEVDKRDVGSKLWDEYDSFVEDNHFYYNTNIEVYQDKGKKMGQLDYGTGDWVTKWGKNGGKLYLVLKRYDGDYFNELRTIKIITVDLNAWETRTINCSEFYESVENFAYANIFVYHEKIYIQEPSFREKLDEIDMNGKKTRVISFSNGEGKKKNIIIQGIMDGRIYYFTWNDNQHMLKSKDLITGEEKMVLQYEQPTYNKNNMEYYGSYFHISGNSLFVMEDFNEKGYTLYRLPIKNGGKMKRVCKQKIVDCDFLDDDIYYIDGNHLLHRKTLKKGIDKIISMRKLEKVKCTKDGLFVNEYKGGEAYDGDGAEDDMIFYMDFDGKHEKRIAEI